jgi:diaminopimelate decarboxylase
MSVAVAMGRRLMEDFEERRLKGLVEDVGTPLYLFRKSVMLKCFRMIKKAFSGLSGEIRIAYALKANPLKEIAACFAAEGAGFDVLSPGELDVILKAGIPVERVIYTSVSETEQEVQYALERGVRTFVIGSRHGFGNLVKLTQKRRIRVDVMLRINPQLEVRAKISTAGRISKFGVPLTGVGDSAERMLPRLLDCNDLNFLGYHFHLGTQVASPVHYIEACRRVLEFTDRHEVSVKALDIGGGFPVDYLEPVPSIDEFGSQISSYLNAHFKEKMNVILEPGRFLVAEAGSLITRVVNIKESSSGTIVVTDTSYNQLPDLLAGQRYPVRTLIDRPTTRGYRIAGNLCDGRDWLEPNEVLLPELKIGDVLVFGGVGAYSNVFRMSFGNMPLPPLVWEEEGRTEILRERTPLFD